jgi:hypothetical protein
VPSAGGVDVRIVTEPLYLVLYGVSGHVEGEDYGRAGQGLMDVLWKEIGAKRLKHKGINYWVYEDRDNLFTGVELEGAVDDQIALVRKQVVVPRYAYWKHIGPYSELGMAYERIHEALRSAGLQPCHPFIEIYGHWTEDESKLETEITIAIE